MFVDSICVIEDVSFVCFSFGTGNLQLENKKGLNFLVEKGFILYFFAKGRFSVRYLFCSAGLRLS